VPAAANTSLERLKPRLPSAPLRTVDRIHVKFVNTGSSHLAPALLRGSYRFSVPMLARTQIINPTSNGFMPHEPTASRSTRGRQPPGLRLQVEVVAALIEEAALHAR
jgi:hypothetical protein